MKIKTKMEFLEMKIMESEMKKIVEKNSRLQIQEVNISEFEDITVFSYRVKNTLTILLLGIYPREMKSYVPSKTCMLFVTSSIYL